MKLGAPPPEYLELLLCRDVYHCTPSELDAQDWERVQLHLVCLNVEAKLAKREQEKGKGGKRG